MHVEVRQTKDVVILDLKGRLTAGLGDQILREAIDELLAEGRRRVLLNLSEVAFVDSAGVGELVAGLKTARRFGAELKLLNVGDRVYSTLDMARLLPTFETYQDEAEAIRSFGPSTRLRRGLLVVADEGHGERVDVRDPQLDRALRAVDRLPHVEVVAVQLQVHLALGAAAHGTHLLRVTT